MRYLLLVLFLVAFCSAALATDIDIGAGSVTGFNRSDIGNDTSLSGVSVTNGLTSVTCSSCVPNNAVGMAGFKVTLAGVVYDVAAVASRSAFTLTAAYAGSTGTITGVWHKFVVFRIYVTQPFIPNGSTVTIPSGSLGSQNWFRRYGASVINDGTQNILYVPAIDNLPATVDSSNGNAAYVGRFYLQGNSGADTGTGYPACVTQWQLSATPTTTSWNQICLYNQPPNPPPPQPLNYYTSAQIDSGIARSCLMNQGVYYNATGNIQSCLIFSSDFSISGGTLNFTGSASGFINRIQEEGSNLTQRQTINFVGSAATAADDAGNSRTNITFDADLNALASNASNGLWAVTGAGTGTVRTLQPPAAGITITNPGGVAGDPTFVLANDLAGLEGIGTSGLAARTAANTWTTRSLVQPSAGFQITQGDGVSGNPTFTLTDDLAGVENIAGTGMVARTAINTWAPRTLTAPAAGFTITNGDGVAGNPTFVLADDLAGIEALVTTGIAVRTGLGTWTTRTITASGSTALSITAGDGVSGNPNIGVDADIEALASLGSTGLIARTGSGTVAARTIAGTPNQITVSNGDGVAGSPTLSTPQDIATSSSPSFSALTLTGGGTVSVGGTFDVITADNSVTGTVAETTLQTSTAASSLLGTNGDGLDIVCAYSVAGTNNTKTVRLKFGGTTVSTLIAAAGDNNVDGYFHVQVVRTGTTTARVFRFGVNNVTTGSATGDGASRFADVSITHANSNSVTVTGQLANTGDTIVARGCVIKKFVNQ